MTRQEMLTSVQELADAVNRDMPGKRLRARLAEAMRRCRGGMNPRDVIVALQAPPGKGTK